MENHLGIGRRPEDVSPRFQFGPQRSVIVDFAVEDDPQAIVVGHRLGAARQIDDGQAAMTERDMVVSKIAGAVWSPVTDAGCHGFDGLAHQRAQGTIDGEGTGNSTHRQAARRAYTRA